MDSIDIHVVKVGYWTCPKCGYDDNNDLEDILNEDSIECGYCDSVFKIGEVKE